VTYKSDDIALLLPTMQTHVHELMLRMGELGFKPVLFDTLRTPGQAAKNAAKGTGSKDSMHCYGAAADIICAADGWDCHKAGCKFYDVLGEQAEELGFVWGRHFPRVDDDHVQGIPVAWQGQMRLLGTNPETAAKRDALVAKWFATHSAK
jgi:hypothetical protein